MNVLLIGGGGRESALAWKISQSPQLRKLYISPGNGGTIGFGTNIPSLSIDKSIAFAKKNRIDLTIIGPETPLTEGIVDKFRKEGLQIFGPTKAASKLEGSKVWAKNFFRKYSIPSAKSYNFSNFESSLDFINNNNPEKWVIKVDGLASGKGVFLPNNISEAKVILDKIFTKNVFGGSGKNIIIEERLYGVEVSVFAFVNNINVSNSVAACDFKRIYDGDLGLNTGGMGAVSPPAFWNQTIENEIRNNIFIPTAKAMIKEGCPYSGILFAGLIITSSGIKVLEFNCRFGDPETQVIIPRINSDLLKIFYKASDPNFNDEIFIDINELNSLGVVIASGGYPEKFTDGKKISGLSSKNDDLNSIIFQAGTKLDDESNFYSNGGRVLICVGLGDDYEESRKIAYNKVSSINFDDMYYRKDIGENRSL